MTSIDLGAQTVTLGFQLNWVINPTSFTDGTGAHIQAPPGITWSSDNPTIVSVVPNQATSGMQGAIVSQSPGQTTVRMLSEGVELAHAAVTVVGPNVGGFTISFKQAAPQ